MLHVMRIHDFGVPEIIKNIKKWSRGVPQNVIDKVNHIFCQLYAAVV